MYSVASRIGYCQCDEHWRLKPEALIDLFQNCSTFQTEDLGMGTAFVEEHQAGWILASWDIHIKRLPMHGEEVTASTWPYGFDRLFGYRNYRLDSVDGELLTYADAVYFYFDLTKGRPIRIPVEVQEKFAGSFEEKLPYEFAPRKILLPETFTDQQPFTVRKGDIDTNHHVNNAVYLRYAADLIPPSASIRELRVEYILAAVEGDTIVPAVSNGSDVTVIALNNPAGKPFATIEVTCST